MQKLSEIKADYETSVDVISFWIADHGDAQAGNQYNHRPSCDVGDMMIELIGRDESSVSYSESLGPSNEFTWDEEVILSEFHKYVP